MGGDSAKGGSGAHVESAPRDSSSNAECSVDIDVFAELEALIDCGEFEHLRQHTITERECGITNGVTIVDLESERCGATAHAGNVDFAIRTEDENVSGTRSNDSVLDALRVLSKRLRTKHHAVIAVRTGVSGGVDSLVRRICTC